MKQPLVSIIVPVYNAEKYLEECIDSIFTQTYPNLEVLLIDDGSKDRSGEICDKYASKDSRIVVHHKPNSGVSRTRNYGLDHCHGDWIAFVDSDDYIDSHYVENFIAHDADYVVGGYNTFGISEHNVQAEKEHLLRLPNDIKDIDAYTKTPEINIVYHICGKVFKRQIIEQLHVRFVEDMILAEDCCFNLDYIRGCKQIMIIPYAGYYYRKYQREVAYKMTLQQYDRHRTGFCDSLKQVESLFDYHFRVLPVNIFSSFFEAYKNRLVIDTSFSEFKKEVSYNKIHLCVTKGSLGFLSPKIRNWSLWCFKHPCLGFCLIKMLKYIRSIRH